MSLGKAPGWRWYLSLVYMLTYRDIRIRYKRAWLGVLWALGVPLMLGFIFAVVYRGFFGAPIPRYPTFVLSALFPWLFFQGAVSSATQSFLTSAELLKRTPVPRPVLPLAAVLVEAFHFLLALLLLLAIGCLRGASAGLHWLALAPAFLIACGMAAGTGMLIAPVQVRFRDTKCVVDLGLMIAFYAAPIIYSPEMVPGRIRPYVVWNPVGILVRPFREILYDGRVPPFEYWLTGTALAALLVAAGFAASKWGGGNAADHV